MHALDFPDDVNQSITKRGIMYLCCHRDLAVRRPSYIHH